MLLASGCGGASKSSGPAGPGAPLLGLVANPVDAAVARGDSNLAAITLAKSTGVNMIQEGDNWHDLEPTPGAIDMARLALRAQVNTALGLAPAHTFRIVDTNQRATPADLAATAWDDPAMFARVDAAVDSILASMATESPVMFSLGNEVDAYFGTHSTELPAYVRLLRREIARIHTARPGVPVGCCTQSPPGNPTAWVGDTLNTYTDVRVYTYYPMVNPSDFQFRPPTTLEGDLDGILAAGPSPVYLQEVGYASSPVCGSSLSAQAEFVSRFRHWHARQSRAKLLGASYFLFTDWTGATLDGLTTYYGFTSPGFRGFLGTLGLRDSSGLAKPAWEAWRNP